MSADVVQVHDSLIVNNAQIKMVDGIMYLFDNSRGKWLSVARTLMDYGVNTNNGHTALSVLTAAGTSTDGAAQVAPPLPRNATITSITYGAHDVEVAPLGFTGGSVNQGDTSHNLGDLWSGHELGFGADDTCQTAVYDGLNIDVDGGVGIAIATVIAGGVTLWDPTALVEIAWRLDE
jgi:hypothetical protein